MVNVNVGDRVVDKTSDRHGVVESFVRPLSFGYKPKVKARIKLDNGNVIEVEPHNLAVEERYVKPKYDPIGINAQQNPNDRAEGLTPAKPRRGGRKTTKKAVMDDIVSSSVS